MSPARRLLSFLGRVWVLLIPGFLGGREIVVLLTFHPHAHKEQEVLRAACVASCDWSPHSPLVANLDGEEPSLTGGAVVKVQISTDDVKRHQLLGVGCAGRGGRFSEVSQPFQKHVQLLAPDGTVFYGAEPQRPDDEAAARPQPGPGKRSSTPRQVRATRPYLPGRAGVYR